LLACNIALGWKFAQSDVKSNVFNVLDHINGNSMHDVVSDALYTCGDVVLKALGMGYFLNATAFCHICPCRNPSFFFLIATGILDKTTAPMTASFWALYMYRKAKQVCVAPVQTPDTTL